MILDLKELHDFGDYVLVVRTANSGLQFVAVLRVAEQTRLETVCECCAGMVMQGHARGHVDALSISKVFHW